VAHKTFCLEPGEPRNSGAVFAVELFCWVLGFCKQAPFPNLEHPPRDLGMRSFPRGVWAAKTGWTDQRLNRP